MKSYLTFIHVGFPIQILCILRGGIIMNYTRFENVIMRINIVNNGQITFYTVLCFGCPIICNI